MRNLAISILRFLWPLAVLAVVLTPIIGVTASWAILATLAVVTALLSITWLFQSHGELRGRIIAEHDGNQTYYFFQLNGDASKIEEQDVVVFEVARTSNYAFEGSRNSSP